MRTEKELIYTIWDLVRGGEISIDDPIGERLLRSFLRAHRGKHLNQYYKKGYQIPDEAFQTIGTVGFRLENGNQVSAEIPKIIQFKDRFGIAAFKDDYTISVVNSEDFVLSQKDKYNKFHPKLQLVNRKLHFYLGQEQESSFSFEDVSNTSLNRVVRKLKEESLSGNVNCIVRAVLVNPDDEPGYDFETSAYPMPDELIDSLMNSVTARDFNIFLRMKSDEVSDGRNKNAEFNTREEF